MTAAPEPPPAAPPGPAILSKKQLREAFAAENADMLAAQVGAEVTARLPPSSTRSARCVWYADPDALTLVVGDQEQGDVDLALAVGLAELGQRTLQLVLPAGWHEPTLQRWAWLRPNLPLRVWTHHEGTVTGTVRPSRQETLDKLHGAEDPALHLGARTSWVESLMRWAGEQPDLDPAHRRDVRAWQCRGQRVLRIQRTAGGLRIVAGIDWGAASPHPSPQPLHLTGPLTAQQAQTLQSQVLEGCRQRLTGVARKADEHWLQAVLRRHPRRLGLEQPVLRELPAWRPSGSLATKQELPRGRGFVDLAGLDATGTLLLVETKLGADDMLILQGLDYLAWAEANRDRLTQRLDCRRDVPFEIAYCVGGKDGGAPSWSSRTGAQLAALANDLRWHVQELTDWTDDDPRSHRLPLRTYPPGTNPADADTHPVPQTAPLGSGTYTHQLITVATKPASADAGWQLTTALHRTPDGSVSLITPWDQQFPAAGDDPASAWHYLYARVIEERGGNGYTYSIAGCEVAHATQLVPLVQTQSRELAALAVQDADAGDAAAESALTAGDDEPLR